MRVAPHQLRIAQELVDKLTPGQLAWRIKQAETRMYRAAENYRQARERAFALNIAAGYISESGIGGQVGNTGTR